MSAPGPGGPATAAGLQIFLLLRGFQQWDRLPAAVERWEQLGVDGIAEGDHLFNPYAPPHPDPAAHAGADQLTVLSFVAACSQRLRVASTASNVGFQHPALLVRRYAQLAALVGGERVYAGFGAGWARREFAALGLEMPPHADRLDRLEESLRLARALYDDGIADLAGRHVTVSRLPLVPWPATAPRVLVAGGSSRIVELAGRYADHLDLNAPSHRVAPADPQKRLITTTADLEESVERLAGSIAAAGRPPGGVSTSLIVDHVTFCSEREVAEASAQLCAGAGLGPRSLDDCPFELVGEPRRMAERLEELQERLGLRWVAVPNDCAEQLFAEVVPLLSRQ